MLVGGLVHSLFTSIFISLYCFFFWGGGALHVHLSFCLCIFVWVTQSYNFFEESLEVPYSNKDNGYLGPEGLRRSY